MGNGVVFEADSWTATTLEEDRAGDLQHLFERSADYFQTVFGLPVGSAEVQSAFIGLPEGKSYDDKFLLGVLDRDNVLVGHLDVIRDYPEDEVWTLGVFLLAPEVRGSGLGAEILEALARWVGANGGARLRIGVVGWNERGIGFLERAGFRRVGTIDDYASGELVGQLVILERSL